MMTTVYDDRSTARAALLLTLVLGSLAGAGCSRGDAEVTDSAPARAEARDGGATIHFPDGGSAGGAFKTVRLEAGMVKAEVMAPARAVAGISTAVSLESEPIVLFDSPELTSLYSAFVQNDGAYARAGKSLARVKDLYDHQAATGKDLSEAESDVQTSRAALAETEGKLRAAGFNPEEFRHGRAGTLWLISDVPESQLYEVRKGEEAAVAFSSFPGEKMTGRVEAIGDVIDNATRTVKVRIAISNPGGRLKPGMFATVNFGESQGSALAVPQSAIVTVQGKHYLFVKDSGGEYRRRVIELGKQVGENIVVTEGVKAGEEVVTEGTMLLKGLSFGY